MKVKELIQELQKMPQDADVIIQAYGMDNEDWMHISIHGRYNMSVKIDKYSGNVVVYAEEDDPEWGEDITI